MDTLLLGTSTAFGLAASVGLNTTLPLLIVGLLARFGLISLAAPFNALSSDVALGGLTLLVVLELVGDKITGMDTIVQAIQWPLAAAAGAILFASQTSVVSWVHPGLAIVVGLLTAGAVHGARTAIRPMVTGFTLGIGNAAVSLFEDVTAVILTAVSLLVPAPGSVLLFFLLILISFIGYWVVRRVSRSTI